MAIKILRPNAPGSETSIANQYPDSGEHWDKVDEEETADENETYIVNNTSQSYQRDLFSIPKFGGVGTINYVRIWTTCQTFFGDEEDGEVTRSLKTHNIVYDAGGSGSSGYVDSFDTWATNPNTNAPWTWDEIDDLEIGLRLQGGTTPDARCTQVWVEIDYTPGIGDIGIRSRKATETIKIGVKTLEAYDKLRIRKGSKTYGISLVATDNPNASPIRIYSGPPVVNLVIENGVSHECNYTGTGKNAIYGTCPNTYDEDFATHYGIISYHTSGVGPKDVESSMESIHTWLTPYHVKEIKVKAFVSGYNNIGEGEGTTELKIQLFLKENESWIKKEEYYTLLDPPPISAEKTKLYLLNEGWDDITGIKVYAYSKVSLLSELKYWLITTNSYIYEVQAFGYTTGGEIRALELYTE